MPLDPDRWKLDPEYNDLDLHHITFTCRDCGAHTHIPRRRNYEVTRAARAMMWCSCVAEPNTAEWRKRQVRLAGGPDWEG
ncbi:MAG TPA: hypothetical protein VMM79_14290 [Longimicrobiales bacterium]|nr:hypothetical protein [Longimicrobiales bacterium]